MKLVFLSRSGFGDRVRQLLAAHSLSVMSGRTLHFVWPINGHCGAAFDQLFVKLFPAEILEEGPEAPVLVAPEEATWEEVCSKVKQSTDEVVYVQNFVPAQGVGEFRYHMDFNSKIHEVASEFIKSDRVPADAIGVHVRATDQRWQMAPLETYFAFVDVVAAMRERHMFLATDEWEIRNLFIMRYGDRVHVYPTSGFDRGNPSCTMEAAIELCILRRLKSLVISPYSSFSQLAIVRNPIELPRQVGLVLGNE